MSCELARLLEKFKCDIIPADKLQIAHNTSRAEISLRVLTAHRQYPSVPIIAAPCGYEHCVCRTSCAYRMRMASLNLLGRVPEQPFNLERLHGSV
jgi:hypothetical protein